jgi:hypothetical protein
MQLRNFGMRTAGEPGGPRPKRAHQVAILGNPAKHVCEEAAYTLQRRIRSQNFQLYTTDQWQVFLDGVCVTF